MIFEPNGSPEHSFHRNKKPQEINKNEMENLINLANSNANSSKEIQQSNSTFPPTTETRLSRMTLGQEEATTQVDSQDDDENDPTPKNPNEIGLSEILRYGVNNDSEATFMSDNDLEETKAGHQSNTISETNQNENNIHSTEKINTELENEDKNNSVNLQNNVENTISQLILDKSVDPPQPFKYDDIHPKIDSDELNQQKEESIQKEETASNDSKQEDHSKTEELNTTSFQAKDLNEQKQEDLSVTKNEEKESNNENIEEENNNESVLSADNKTIHKSDSNQSIHEEPNQITEPLSIASNILGNMTNQEDTQKDETIEKEEENIKEEETGEDETIENTEKEETVENDEENIEKEENVENDEENIEEEETVEKEDENIGNGENEENLNNQQESNDQSELENYDEEEKYEEMNTISIRDIAYAAVTESDYSNITEYNSNKVISMIRKLQRDALKEGDYEFADQAQKATAEIVNYVNDERFIAINEAKADDLNSRLEATRNDLEYLKEHWKIVLNNAKEQMNHDIENLEKENENELNEFDETLQKELPLEYRRFSPELLQLRSKQKAMVASRRYKDAKKLKEECDKMEKIEMDKNRIRYLNHHRAKRVELIKKQQSKVEARQAKWNQTINRIKNVSNYEIGHAKKSETQLVKKVESANELNKTIKASSDQKMKSRNLDNSNEISSRSLTAQNSTNPRSARNKKDKRELEAIQFRQRAMINRITYSNLVQPKVKRPVPRSAR